MSDKLVIVLLELETLKLRISMLEFRFEFDKSIAETKANIDRLNEALGKLRQ